MSETSAREQPPRSWPGRTRVIISGVLAALAVPLLVFTVWTAVDALANVPCHRNDHPGYGSDYCGDTNLFAAIGLMYGTITLVVGGSMAMGAAGLFLRPNLRGRVVLIIASLIICIPILFLVALNFVWLPLR
jgi:hypothetical protein